MPKFTDRKCTECEAVLKDTATHSSVCSRCHGVSVQLRNQEAELEQLRTWGYQLISGPTKNEFGKRVYEVVAPCGCTSFTTTFGNLRTGISRNSKKKLPMPCGVCGPKHRMRKALEGFLEIHGIDYDLTKANEYRRKVRGLSEVTYRKFKRVINPENLPRGRNSGYHVDHVKSIIECFKAGWTPERAAAPENLQMLPWTENLSKGG